MNKLRMITAGESHGPALTGVIEGLPAGLGLSEGDITPDLRRRQGGYGRGGRMKIESDLAEILSGVRWGRTLGSPLTLQIVNRDFSNWSEGMSVEARHEGSIPAVTRPRPGHADLAGTLKYAHDDVRNVLERSSARETAMRVALGAVCKRLLGEFGVRFGSYVTRVGSVSIDTDTNSAQALSGAFELAEGTELRCPDPEATRRMMAHIDRATAEGDSLGGEFVVFALGLPVGLGSHVHWDRRLGGRLAQALMSIQAIKGVEIGLGFEAASRPGSLVMDPIVGAKPPYMRTSNHAGGIEGGMTTGGPVVMRAAMKPIPTLRRALRSIDLRSGQEVEAAYERSDVCAVPAAGVVGEAMAAMVLADAFLDKFGGDSVGEVGRNLAGYLGSLGFRG